MTSRRHQRRAETLILVLAFVLILLSARDTNRVRETVEVVTVRQGDTLWRLSYGLTGGRDRRAWVARTCTLNGWRAVPTLRPGERVALPVWTRGGLVVDDREVR
jgi:predicted Zn-dependent protease